jgi:hypothetical protein
MRRLMLAAVAALAFSTAADARDPPNKPTHDVDSASPALAPDAHGRCHDAHGKFAKCPVHGMPLAAHKPCRDAHGKFIKCHV